MKLILCLFGIGLAIAQDPRCPSWIANGIKFECFQQGSTSGFRPIGCVNAANNNQLVQPGGFWSDANFKYTCTKQGDNGMKYDIVACITSGKKEIQVGQTAQENGKQYECSRNANGEVSFKWSEASTCVMTDGTVKKDGDSWWEGDVQYKCTKINGKLQSGAWACKGPDGNPVLINSQVQISGKWNKCVADASKGARFQEFESEQPGQQCLDSTGAAHEVTSKWMVGKIQYICIVQGLKWVAQANGCVHDGVSIARGGVATIGNDQWYCNVGKLGVFKVKGSACVFNGQSVKINSVEITNNIRHQCQVQGEGELVMVAVNCADNDGKQMNRDQVKEISAGVAYACKFENNQFVWRQLTSEEYAKWKAGSGGSGGGISGSGGSGSGAEKEGTTTGRPPPSTYRPPATTNKPDNDKCKDESDVCEALKEACMNAAMFERYTVQMEKSLGMNATFWTGDFAEGCKQANLEEKEEEEDDDDESSSSSEESSSGSSSRGKHSGGKDKHKDKHLWKGMEIRKPRNAHSKENKWNFKSGPAWEWGANTEWKEKSFGGPKVNSWTWEIKTEGGNGEKSGWEKQGGAFGGAFGGNMWQKNTNGKNAANLQQIWMQRIGELKEKMLQINGGKIDTDHFNQLKELIQKRIEEGGDCHAGEMEQWIKSRKTGGGGGESGFGGFIGGRGGFKEINRGGWQKAGSKEKGTGEQGHAKWQKRIGELKEKMVKVQGSLDLELFERLKEMIRRRIEEGGDCEGNEMETWIRSHKIGGRGGGFGGAGQGQGRGRGGSSESGEGGSWQGQGWARGRGRGGSSEKGVGESWQGHGWARGRGRGGSGESGQGGSWQGQGWARGRGRGGSSEKGVGESWQGHGWGRGGSSKHGQGGGRGSKGGHGSGEGSHEGGFQGHGGGKWSGKRIVIRRTCNCKAFKPSVTYLITAACPKTCQVCDVATKATNGKMKIFGAVKHLIGEFHTRFAANRKRLQKKPDQKPPCEHNKTGPAPGGAPNPYNRWEQP